MSITTYVVDQVFGDNASGELPPPPQSTGAANIVNEGFSTAQQYAQNAFNTASSFLSQIAGATTKLQTLPPVDGTLPPVSDFVSAFVPPTQPVPPTGLTMNLPAAPGAPSLTPVQGVTVGQAPQFTAQPAAIDLSFGPPAPLSATVPTAPTLPAVNVPTSPAIVLPDVPTLLGINVPGEPLLNLPTFTAVQPGSPLAPDYIFSFNENAFTEQLLTDLKTQLDAWVNGASTGLAPAVEQAIWDRDRAREMVASQRKISESMRMFAQRGFTKPPGALNLDIQQGLQDSMGVLSSASRDIMIKQADLEQSNRRFAFETAWKVEEGLIQYNSQIAGRAFEAAKFAQQVGIDIFHEVVARYTADIQAYQANVEVYKAQIQAELAKLDVFKAEIEAQRLIGEINQQSVEIYKARVEAAHTIVDIFRAQVEAANASAMVNKTTIDAFAAQVGAYAEQVRAKASEYEAYATHVKAEVSKLDAFTAQASAYDSQVQGFKATVDALVAAKNIEIDVSQRLPLDVFKSLTDVYRAQVGAETERVGALARVFETEGNVYNAEVQGESARVNAEVSVLKADTELAVATGNLRIEAAKANIQLLTEQVQLLVESIKGGAQVAAQLAASALSSINLSGQIGDHVTYGVGYNVNNSSQASVSSSITNNTSKQTSESETTNTSTQTSTSDVTSHNYNYTP